MVGKRWNVAIRLSVVTRTVSAVDRKNELPPSSALETGAGVCQYLMFLTLSKLLLRPRLYETILHSVTWRGPVITARRRLNQVLKSAHKVTLWEVFSLSCLYLMKWTNEKSAGCKYWRCSSLHGGCYMLLKCKLLKCLFLDDFSRWIECITGPRCQARQVRQEWDPFVMGERVCLTVHTCFIAQFVSERWLLVLYLMKRVYVDESSEPYTLNHFLSKPEVVFQLCQLAHVCLLVRSRPGA